LLATNKPVLAWLARSLEGPLKQIAENAGMEGGVVVAKVKEPEGQ